MIQVNANRSTESVYEFLNNMTTTVPIQTSSIPSSAEISIETTTRIIPTTTPISITSQASQSSTSIQTRPYYATSKLSTKFLTLSPSCTSDYPTPTNYQLKKVSYNLIQNAILKNRYNVGSSVKFQCIPGFYVLNTKLNLTTVCQSDSTWTQVARCEQLPCWDKVNIFSHKTSYDF